MRLEVLCEDRTGLTRELLEILSSKNIDLRGIEIDIRGIIYLDFPEIQFEDFSQIMAKIRRITGVKDVRKIQLMPSEHRQMEALSPLPLSVVSERSAPVSNLSTFQHLIGISQQHNALISQAKKLACLTSPLLIVGETGTGKEMLAKACHHYSDRSASPFLVLSCVSMPDDVAETELFGCADGVFHLQPSLPLQGFPQQGFQQKGKKGIFEQANGGTVFLDEIGEMTPHLQGKLLRFLQDGKFRRVGEDAEVEVNVRIIASTCHDLFELTQTGRFRHDLFYRLNVLTLTIVPLRQRIDDIAPLLEHFIAKHSQQLGITPPRISDKLMAKLVHYSWPGNMRQMDNMVLRALTQSDGSTLNADDFALPEIKSITTEMGDFAADESLDEIMKRYESQVLTHLYQAYPSSRKLAKRLNVSHTSIANKLREYGIGQKQ